jgi:hypothetical protein
MEPARGLAKAQEVEIDAVGFGVRAIAVYFRRNAAMVTRAILYVLFFAGITVAQDAASASRQLPSPAGKYGVSRIGYDWTEKSRVEPTAKIPGDHREIMVYVWYPADKNRKGGRAEYLPGADAIANSTEANAMKEFWGEAWELVSLGKVQIDTSEKAPLAKGKERFPLIIFSPGLGVNSTTYATLIQEVVSRGYVVAAIEPTFEVPAVAFPDGRVLGLSEDATGRHKSGPAGDTKEKFLKRLHTFDTSHLDKWAGDVHFVIDKVTELNAADKDTGPFSGRIDLNNIAAWGHSFGGQAAVHACQIDSRIKACLNAEGWGQDGPIFSFADTPLPSQPLMWMEVHHDPPTDALLTVFHTTREAWEKEHQRQRETNQKELKACPGGSFHVTINLPGIEPFSFTDKPLIQAKSREDIDQARHALEAIEQHTIAFFDRYLKQQNSGLPDSAATLPAGITVEQFGTAPK